MTEKRESKLQGIILVIAAGFFFSLMTLMVRMAGDLPVVQKAVFRNSMATLVAAFLLIRSGEGLHIKKENRWAMLARSVFGTIGLVANFYAVDKIGLADANMLNKLSPFFATVFSVYILKEKANKYDWGAIAIAFTGALLIIKPSFQITTAYSLVGMFSGMTAGMAYTCVRWLGKNGERGPVIVFCFSLFSMLVCLPFTIANYQPMTPKQWVYMISAGTFAGIAQLCITAAYTKAPAKEISVYDYIQILFAALWGVLFLKEIPDIYSFLGYIIIISVAILKWRKNRDS